ncbi:hypothetical protein [Gynuella sunshinyii]|uniref:Uncharacterized protein n=1 Tax=Gynuella sunshinyii YC6258 TaxID=1445510 RepID=A0A0C5VZV8_9GAMM|nr:hypothetical protein [Gynuella sunshinyii]AJQ95964.1 hypothetical Protein YC6258_03928 [Gynuella sunshinyii YC6258]
MRSLAKTGLLFSVALTAQFSIAAPYDTVVHQFGFTESYNNIHGTPIPNLTLNNVTDGSVTVVESETTSITELNQFTLEFANAPSLRVSKLSKDNTGTYYSMCSSGSNNVFVGSVKNQWLFREVQVVVCPQGAPMDSEMEFKYGIYAKTFEKYDSSNSGYMENLLLSEGSFRAADVTPNPVADVYTTEFNNKRLSLRLLKQPMTVYTPSQGMQYGVAIKANWLGHGEKVLIVNSYDIPVTSFTQSIALSAEPEGDPNMITITYMENSDAPNTSRMINLRDLLESAYGPL